MCVRFVPRIYRSAPTPFCRLSPADSLPVVVNASKHRQSLLNMVWESRTYVKIRENIIGYSKMEKFRL